MSTRQSDHRTDRQSDHQADERCHWDGEQRVSRRHLRDCNTSGCEGCAPCQKVHCAMPRCSHHLRAGEERVCASCVGEVREGLQRIVQLCGFAPYVAATSSIDSAVAYLVGPVAESAQYAAYREAAIYNRALCRCLDCPDLWREPEGPECSSWQACEHYVCRRRNGRPTCPGLADWLDLADDERHPLWVLGSWDRLVAEELGHNRTLKVTVATAASYLEANLTDLARLEDFAFDELAREVADCVVHVEGVLLLRLREETGAPCPVCHAQGRKAKPLIREFDDDDRTGGSDYWVCPSAVCGQAWSVDEYDKYVEREAVLHQEKLTASQIALVYRVNEATVRQWAKRGHVARRGFDGQRRQLYDVADVKACRNRRDDPHNP